MTLTEFIENLKGLNSGLNFSGINITFYKITFKTYFINFFFKLI